MQTFEEAQAAARAAKAEIERLERLHKSESEELALVRKRFADTELRSIDALKSLEAAIAEQRANLQAALQRQSDAPLSAPEDLAAQAFSRVAEIGTEPADPASQTAAGYAFGA